MVAPSTPPAPAPDRTLPYGPQTVAVRRFLQRLAALSPGAWDEAAAEHERIEATPAYAAADRDLSRAVERSGRVAERDAVLGPLAQLLALEEAEAESTDGAESVPPLHAVAAAALAAVLALVVRDVLPPRAFAALYEAFAELVPAATLDA